MRVCDPSLACAFPGEERGSHTAPVSRGSTVCVFTRACLSCARVSVGPCKRECACTSAHGRVHACVSLGVLWCCPSACTRTPGDRLWVWVALCFSPVLPPSCCPRNTPSHSPPTSPPSAPPHKRPWLGPGEGLVLPLKIAAWFSSLLLQIPHKARGSQEHNTSGGLRAFWWGAYQGMPGDACGSNPVRRGPEA